jgi:hypothetical protein
MSMQEIENDLLRCAPHVIHTLSFHAAMKIVKWQIAARGLKLREFSAKDLQILAGEYLTLHKAELIAATIARVRAEPEFLKLALSEAKRRGRYWPKPVKPDGSFTYPVELMHQAFAELMQPGPGKRVLPQDVIDNPKLFPA